MDKGWMKLEDRTLPEYENGDKLFLDFAYSSIEPWEKIRCPCRKCNNVYYQNRDDVEADLLEYGILQNYVTWVFHGEELDESDDEEFDFDEEEEEENDQVELEGVQKDNTRGNEHSSDMQRMLEDYYTATKTNAWSGDGCMRNDTTVPEWESDKFMRLLTDVDKELYPGCEKFSKLSFIVTLMHIKILSRWSNKSFSMLLEVLKKALPDGETLPCSYYEAKKIIQDLDLDYEKIHACVNDCLLFHNEYEKVEQCPKCSAPRYKFTELGDNTNTEKKRKKIPQKVLAYISEHKEELKQNGCSNVEQKHEECFAKWFEIRINLAPTEEAQPISEDLLHLAYGPDKRVTHYEACIMNGLRFHTKQREKGKKTQNSGVVVKVEEESGFQNYYGVLTNIIQLDYLGNHQVVLFKCDWYGGKLVQIDKYNCTSINVSKPWKTNEPYVLASQAQQVFYVDDIKLGNNWKVAIEFQARSSWNVLENKDDDECPVSIEADLQNAPRNSPVHRLDSFSDFVEWYRNDIPAIAVNSDGVTPLEDHIDEFIDDQDEEEEEEDYTLAEYDDEGEDCVDENEDDFEGVTESNEGSRKMVVPGLNEDGYTLEG
ncbi:hypothetical protein Salat_0214600 [Sesamum alatum]|uniref:Transposase-associated domain-containing protein n=1 Tax=Sesamum alatum TaxID=300844 RepID=A0AAE2CY82_9LAMI|nr:hypothetical protein Salat_0214600 [Sesamum alatum]